MPVSDLSAGPVRSRNHLVVNNDSAADARSERHHNQIVIAGTAAFPALAERRRIGIIECLCANPGQFLHLSDNIHDTPVEVHREIHMPVLMDRPRHIDADSLDLALVESSLRDLVIDRLRDIRQDPAAVLLCPRRNLPLFQKIAFCIKETTLYRGPSDIDSKTIFLHNALHSFFSHRSCFSSSRPGLCHRAPERHYTPFSSVCG